MEQETIGLIQAMTLYAGILNIQFSTWLPAGRYSTESRSLNTEHCVLNIDHSFISLPVFVSPVQQNNIPVCVVIRWNNRYYPYR